jgi:RHS repeat-associated protein
VRVLPRDARAVISAGGLALFALLGAFPAGADSHPNTEGGVDINQVFHAGGLDNVNLFNGALTVSLPLGISYPVNGALGYQLHLVAGSNPWDFWTTKVWTGTGYVDQNESAPSHCSNAGLGWRVSLGALGFGNFPNGQSTYPVCAAVSANPGDGTNGTGGVYAIYEGPDSSQHLFYATLHPNEPDDTLNGVQDSVAADVENVQYTRDGSYLRLKRQGDGTATIEFPDGTIHTFDSLGRLTEIRDRFSDGQGRPVNWVHIDYLRTAAPPPAASCAQAPAPIAPTASETSCWKISDSQGRAHWIFFRADLPVYNETGVYGSVVSRVALQGPGGAWAQYGFSYATASTGRGCPMHDLSSGDVTVPLLASVQQPDGSLYAPAPGQPQDGYIVQPAGPGQCTDGSGSLKHLGLPTRGSLDWTYQTYFFPSGSTAHSFRTTNFGVATRTTRDASGSSIGTWTYTTTAATHNPAPSVTNTVLDPAGNSTVRYFSLYLSGPGGSLYGPGANPFDYGRPYNPQVTLAGSGSPTAGDQFLSEQVFDAGQRLRRSTYVRYERDLIDQASVVGLNPMPPNATNNDGRVAQQTVVHDDGAQASLLDQDFDGVGHYRHRTFGGSFAGWNGRTEHRHFNPDRLSYGVDQASNTQVGSYSYLPAAGTWLLNLSSYEYEQQHGNPELRSFCHDPATGFLLRRRSYAQRTNDVNAMSATDVIVQLVPESNGAAPTGNVGAENYFGGDQSPVGPTSLDLCQQALPATPEYHIGHSFRSGTEAIRQYAGTGFYSLSRDIDPATGLVTASRDTAGIQTHFTYDAMGRLVYIQPAQGAFTQFLYSLSANPVSLTIERQDNSGGHPGAPLARTKHSYDGIGRRVKTEVWMPDGSTSKQSIFYDGLDRKVSESEIGSADQTFYLNYDAFGRVGTIRPPDSTAASGYAHDIHLSYSGVQQVQRTVGVAGLPPGSPETAATTVEAYDRFGHLASVCEASGGTADAVACGSSQVGGPYVTTSYGYDPGGRLISAVTTAAVSGSARTTQNRSFSYDGRGFLSSESHPETASAKTYSGYDSRGHAHRMLDGVHDLSFTYDSAERPLLVYNSAYGPNCNPNPITTPTCVKQFAYDNVAAGALGRLYQASRFNRPLLNGNPLSSKWTYTYTYQGLDGRLSQRALQHTYNGQTTGSQESFVQSWTYTTLGQVATETYPDCAPSFTSCAGTGSRLVTNEYLAGPAGTVAGDRLVGVDFYTAGPGITYYPNGMVSGVTHFNNVTAAYGRDPNGLARPASITVSGPGGVLWSTGPYAYDGAGNVKQVGQGYFEYDPVGRLTSAQVETNPVDDPNPAHDAFASQSVGYDAFGNIKGFSNLSTPTNPATNQLSGATYDAAGNVLSWNAGPPLGSVASYDHDEMNQINHYHVGGQDWLYVYDADDERVASFQVSTGFERWTLRGLDGRVRRSFELASFGGWTNGWSAQNLWEDYVYRDGVLLSASVSTGERRHFDVDHLGTVRLVTNRSGLASGATYHVYLPYGEETAATFNPGDGERMRFTGHERDLADPSSDQDDFDYMHARHASPITGRFLSVDSATSNPGKPQSWNRYAYALDNPLCYLDPTGQAAESSFFQQVQGFFEGLFNKVFPPPPVKADPNAQGLAAEGEISKSQAERMSPGVEANLVQKGLNDFGSIAAAGAIVGGKELAIARSLDIVAGILKPGGTLIGEAGSSSSIRFLSGGAKAAGEFFAKLTEGGEVVKESAGLKVVEIKGVGTFAFRTISATKGVEATIDVVVRGIGIRKLKFKS